MRMLSRTVKENRLLFLPTVIVFLNSYSTDYISDPRLLAIPRRVIDRASIRWSRHCNLRCDTLRLNSLSNCILLLCRYARRSPLIGSLISIGHLR